MANSSTTIIFIFILAFSKSAISESIIRTLPGFKGGLPFLLETGYIGVGKLEEKQLFYYFIESERSSKDDPLMLWLTGGPGCSAFSGLVFEIGPLKFNYDECRGNKPVFELNPYSWTKVANIIFLDAPIGTGFSYATTWEAYSNLTDTISAADNYEFLRKWLADHPKFLPNPLYIGGDSYSGMIVPIIIQEISNGNEVGLQPLMNLKGYMLGNPLTDMKIDYNSRVQFSYLKALISKKMYESFKRNCKGEYIHPDTSNALCMENILRINQSISKLNNPHILEPVCTRFSPKPKPPIDSLLDSSIDILLSTSQIPQHRCRKFGYLYSYIWASDKIVQEALHIRKGTIKEWIRCNTSLSYTVKLHSSVEYHRNLTKKTGLRALIYSGDHDMLIPHVGTAMWIESLNLTIASDWQPWFVDGQVAGYTMEYSQQSSSLIAYRLTFATVKGGGHTAPEYNPKQCFAMIDRWFDYYSL